jgi:CheY-like chemotaxis protein
MNYHVHRENHAAEVGNVLCFNAVGVVCRKQEIQEEVLELWGSFADEFDAYRSIEKAVYHILRKPEQGTLLIVVLDYLLSNSDIIEDLNRLRRRRTSCGIILLSADFSKDDYSKERLVIADVSLKLPLDHDLSPQEVLLAVSTNNKAWCKRQAEMRGKLTKLTRRPSLFAPTL